MSKRKIIDYHLIYSTYLCDLNRSVESYIKDGYEPFGSPFFTSYQQIEYEGHKSMQTHRYHQAMVKYDD